MWLLLCDRVCDFGRAKHIYLLYAHATIAITIYTITISMSKCTYNAIYGQIQTRRTTTHYPSDHIAVVVQRYTKPIVDFNTLLYTRNRPSREINGRNNFMYHCVIVLRCVSVRLCVELNVQQITFISPKRQAHTILLKR